MAYPMSGGLFPSPEGRRYEKSGHPRRFRASSLGTPSGRQTGGDRSVASQGAHGERISDGDLERRARRWDVMVTGVLVLFLLIPIPFAQFRGWPGGEPVLERPVLPWSSFRLCYVPAGGGRPVEEVYRFTWNGKLVPGGGELRHPAALESLDAPLLAWQRQPEVELRSLHRNGEFLLVRTRWRPVAAWPLGMLLASWKDHGAGVHGGGAGR